MTTINNILIEAAIKSIKDGIEGTDKTVPKEMNGYVSSFGAAVIQSGLVPAIIFYGAEKQEKDKAPERPKMIKALVQIINKKRSLRGKDLLSTDLKLLLEQLLKSKDLRVIQGEFADAAIAFKLALRIFKPSEKTKK